MEGSEIKAKVKKIAHLLEKEYGVPQRERAKDPLDILIQTILSQNTNDLNRDRAYQKLKNRYPKWENVLSARRTSLIATIRTGGLAEQKARRIQEILRWIQMREGRLSLSFLEKMESEEIQRVFEGQKGIGPKTVHCLLLFGLGREAFPVDTHILRIGKRLGFIPEKMDGVKAHPWMAPLVPRGKSLSFHINLIRFGRTVCKAKNPQCTDCFLAKECFHHPQ